VLLQTALQVALFEEISLQRLSRSRDNRQYIYILRKTCLVIIGSVRKFTDLNAPSYTLTLEKMKVTITTP